VIVLDTNVVSALMRPAPEEPLLRWSNGESVSSLWITSITTMEVRFGVELHSKGRRRTQIERAFTDLLDRTLQGRILAFDRDAAEKAAGFAGTRRRSGRPIEFRDAEIAGIVAAHGRPLRRAMFPISKNCPSGS
jgi:hypothetical protein